MSDDAGAPGETTGDLDWYSLRDVARVLGLSRQAVHTRVRKGQLSAQQVDGVWRVPGGAVAAAVQAQRRKALSMGSVRVLPVRVDEYSGADEDVVARLNSIESIIAGLQEEHRQALAQRDTQMMALEQRCRLLQAALHQMVDLLGSGEPSDPSRSGR